MMYLPMRPACQEVPHPQMMKRLAPRIFSRWSMMPESLTVPSSGWSLPFMELRSARGCSNISLSMKWGEAALLDFVEAELELADDGGLLDVLEVGYLEFLSALDVGDLALSEVHYLVGVLDDG